MEDNASAEETLRSRLENMDRVQLAAVGIKVSLVPSQKKLIEQLCLFS